MRRWWLLRLVLLCLVGALAGGRGICYAAAPANREEFLQRFKEKRSRLRDYEAHFVQEKTSTLFDQRTVSRGVLKYLAPRMMCWEYQSPDRVKLWIDGETLAFYAEDLRQLDKYPLASDRVAATLFLGFTSDVGTLEKAFDVDLVPLDKVPFIAPKDRKKGLFAFRLRSRPGDEGNLAEAYILLGEDDYLPRLVLILDKNGDRTLVRLTRAKVNSGLSKKDLEVRVPSDVIVVEHGAQTQPGSPGASVQPSVPAATP